MQLYSLTLDHGLVVQLDFTDTGTSHNTQLFQRVVSDSQREEEAR